MSEIETWVAIPGFDGRYEVSSEGRVKSLGRSESYSRILNNCVRDNVVRMKCEKLLTPSRGLNGYLTVRLLGKTFTVHSLVLTSFVGPRPKGFAGCHCDGDKENNRLSNLRWDTYTANNRERFIHMAQRRANA